MVSLAFVCHQYLYNGSHHPYHHRYQHHHHCTTTTTIITISTVTAIPLAQSLYHHPYGLVTLMVL